jgi:hypothetical protein
MGEQHRQPRFLLWLVLLEEGGLRFRWEFPDAFAASRRGPHQDRPAHELRPVERYLLHSKTAHRVAMQVDRVEAESVDERPGVARGLLDRVRGCASR